MGTSVSNGYTRLLSEERGSRDASLGQANGEMLGMPMLTVIAPVYNEAATIDEVLRRVTEAPYDKQVIVVDDGSSDGTRDVIEKWRAQPHVEVFTHPENRGKGSAIRTALQHACGRYTIIQDGDLECDPGDYARLMEPLLTGRAEVVFGSRYLPHADLAKHRWTVLRCGVSVLNLCVRVLYRTRLTDEATCYKVLPTAALRAMDLQCRRFEFCPEVTAKACRLGLKILEVPIHYCPRSVHEGKKIRWKDGLEALATLWRWRNWQPDGSFADERREMARDGKAFQVDPPAPGSAPSPFLHTARGSGRSLIRPRHSADETR